MGNESKFLVLSYLGGSNKLGYRFLRIIYENMLERFSFSFLVREKLLKLFGEKRVLEKLWSVSCFTRKIQGIKKTNLSRNYPTVLHEEN